MPGRPPENLFGLASHSLWLCTSYPQTRLVKELRVQLKDFDRWRKNFGRACPLDRCIMLLEQLFEYKNGSGDA
jgi:hypothetical protein